MQYSNQSHTKVQEEFFNTLKELVSKTVMRYIARGIIPRREQEDVETAIIEKFLIKREKIESSFQGKAKITTYYIAVINRMCAEVIRKEQKHWYTINDQIDNHYHQQATVSFDTAKQTLVTEELLRFRASLMLFNGIRYKVILFLKYYFDIPLTDSDIKNYAGDKTEDARKILSERAKLSKAEVNEKLATLVSIIEKKEIKGDAVRMWINKQMDTILCRMNGRNNSFHCKETIGLMLEMQNV